MRKIIAQHYIALLYLKLRFKKLVFGFGSARSVSAEILKIIVDVSIVGFCKGGSQMGGRLIVEDFVH